MRIKQTDDYGSIAGLLDGTTDTIIMAKDRSDAVLFHPKGKFELASPIPNIATMKQQRLEQIGRTTPVEPGESIDLLGHIFALRRNPTPRTRIPSGRLADQSSLACCDATAYETSSGSTPASASVPGHPRLKHWCKLSTTHRLRSQSRRVADLGRRREAEGGWRPVIPTIVAKMLFFGCITALAQFVFCTANCLEAAGSVDLTLVQGGKNS